MGTNGIDDSVREKRRLLRAIVGTTNRFPISYETGIVAQERNWRDDWREHLLENSESASDKHPLRSRPGN